MIRFDHAKLVRRDTEEVKRFRQWVLGGQVGELSEVIIVHDRNGNCCRREPWRATARTLIEALQPATQQILVNLNHVPLDTTNERLVRRA